MTTDRFRGALLFGVLAGCSEPDLSRLFGEASVSVVDDEAAAAQRFVERIDQAHDTLHVALPAADDATLTDALIAAHDRGVAVEVITDFDVLYTCATPTECEATSAPIQSLLDAEVPVRVADAGLTYFEFNLNDDAIFPSAATIMSDVWVVTDAQQVLAASTIGRAGAGARILYDLAGEDLIDDLLAEHNQIFGGTDATAVTAFDGPAKSITDLRWRYGTHDDLDLEMWFGPQERLTKRVIDAVYRSRTGVRILTDDLANEGLAKALQDKAERGFDVTVVVGPHFGQSSSLLSRFFEDTPDVEKRRFTGADVVPTVVLVDYEAQDSGLFARSEAMVMTHDLYSAARLHRGEPVVSDQLIDGTMWTLSSADGPAGGMLLLETVFEDHYDRSEAF